METPLDNVPPARANSGAPFGAGSGLVAGGGGGVAVIGIAGSTFRLLENICIALSSLVDLGGFSLRQRPVERHPYPESIMGQLFTKVNLRFGIGAGTPSCRLGGGDLSSKRPGEQAVATSALLGTNGQQIDDCPPKPES